MNLAALCKMVLVIGFLTSAATLWAQGGTSPEQAYRQYINALYRADPDQALAVIAGRPDQIEFIRVFLTCLDASNAFRQKYIAAYGAAEWAKFGQDEPEAGVPAFHLPDPIPLNIYRRLLKQSPTPDGRDYVVSQENGEMRIIYRNGKWYLAAASLGIEGRASQYEILTAVLREYQGRVGAPEETPAGLRVAMKQDLGRTGQW